MLRAHHGIRSISPWYLFVAMRLLVSVASAAEASVALAGGADVIDAKDPLAGALGAVSAEVLRGIHATIAGARPVTAALGDAADEAAIEPAARAFAAAGAALVKVGFAGIASARRVSALIAAAARGARAGSDGHAGVVAVAYADADRAASLEPFALVEVAARVGATGLLLDTADKGGPGLRGLVAPGALAAWVAEAHETGLIVALAGKLTADDLSFVRDAGADIVGVRGAACSGGRTGRVTANKVRQLVLLCATTGSSRPTLLQLREALLVGEPGRVMPKRAPGRSVFRLLRHAPGLDSPAQG